MHLWRRLFGLGGGIYGEFFPRFFSCLTSFLFPHALIARCSQRVVARGRSTHCCTRRVLSAVKITEPPRFFFFSFFFL
ncbi:hypothetical protein TRSC58_07531 [Trypanosoma rangeli SC58]|uniref:Uncharacterized protein n=1 Tax=Trypanosoma rangeli SC58 TaxID=429131 RepID=A0A061IV29_TRYRA|nr:hypothetical protein TRSC58_07531 [Trypanosoma rangeli SC58]